MRPAIVRPTLLAATRKNGGTARLIACLFLAANGLSACTKPAGTPPPGESAESRTIVQAPAGAPAAPADKAPVGRAQASMGPVGGTKVVGTLMLTALPDGAGVQIQGALSGLTPGPHGIHIHEVGDCSSADGMAAGGHFNPTGAPHGAIEDAKSHVGDLGNIVANAEGRATFDAIKKAATLGVGATDLLGRSIIVHGQADDVHSQPAGSSGPRVACGVVQKL